MIRTSLGLIVVFALIAAACVAFGAYFSYVTLQNAHRKAIEARFGVTAERIAGSVQSAAALGISLPAQTTLAALLRREARLDPTILSIDVTDDDAKILFSSDPARIGVAAGLRPTHAVSRRVENDLAATIGAVTVRYDSAALAAGAAALAHELRIIALPALIAAALATIAIGLLLAAGLRRAAHRAGDPASWPRAARAALAEAEAAHGAANLAPVPGIAAGERP
ncbi:hypothetical protein [Aquabacter spiritensis]|uniref:HAMP domain-containing protein n=1 Tax=Aquabacter spiritensis TaxID=933073 RepID=A0A4R3M3Z4_9HYPH|nr:hypothetical protein [Aquabacter spiritensis]TCT07991.1 hypothetical protein EDC64_101510 [Aquabacter spiritensis]